ncbi:MAG TPA: hypothetical protein VNT26_11805, partial [Candidatus Sulfotelmatobacter sp.]|nr:hypothetical protein [Candidatus Sulfotelmatobacter sp.]
GGNRLQFSISIQPGFRYAVEASTNLMNWVSVATNTGSCLFEDSEASQFPRRYYRSVYLP